MANWKASVVASVVGASAGLSASLPSFVCSGLNCSSCFACAGAGVAAASALIAGLASRRFGKQARLDDGPADSTPRASAERTGLFPAASPGRGQRSSRCGSD